MFSPQHHISSTQLTKAKHSLHNCKFCQVWNFETHQCVRRLPGAGYITDVRSDVIIIMLLASMGGDSQWGSSIPSLSSFPSFPTFSATGTTFTFNFSLAVTSSNISSCLRCSRCWSLTLPARKTSIVPLCLLFIMFGFEKILLSIILIEN